MFRIVAIALSLILIAGYASSEERPRIEADDVVFMYRAGDPATYEAFHGTVVGWGGRPRSNDESVVHHYRSSVEAARERGLRYCGSVDFLVDFGGFIDFEPENFLDAVTRDLDGEPLRVPWLWDHEHKGHPAYWFCTNNPRYQEYLRDQAARAALAEIDGLHIDDYSGSSASSDYNGGCFCASCMDGFAAYLQKNFSADQLDEMGVGDQGDFHYGEFLKERGVTAQSYRSDRGSIPLIHVFQTFQNERMIERITDVFEYAERLRGRPLARSVNSSANYPRTLWPAPALDYFCGEVGHHASASPASVEPVFVYKVVESLNRRQTATASGHDWAWIKANDKPGLVRTWIAQAYALGSVFMAPHNQWCYTNELGTHWWHGQPEDFEDLYRFVREHPELFRGYRSLAQTAIAYTSDYSRTRRLAEHMTRANIPFAVLASPEQVAPAEWDSRLLAPLAFLAGTNADFETRHAESLAEYDIERLADDDVEEWPEAARAAVEIEGADLFRVSLRYQPETRKVVCHILNQEYVLAADSVTAADITIRLPRQLLERAGLDLENLQARLFSPNSTSQAISHDHNDDSLLFKLDQAGLWSAVLLQPLE